MPLTVEPSKPRLCNDNRFLNLWIKDMPFHLDVLLELPRYVSPSSFQSVCDDKSGYNHVLFTLESRPYFGFQWGGWYFTSNTIPFGWKSSAYIYHSIGLQVSLLIIFVPSLYLAPCILMTVKRVKFGSPLRPRVTPLFPQTRTVHLLLLAPLFSWFVIR